MPLSTRNKTAKEAGETVKHAHIGLSSQARKKMRRLLLAELKIFPGKYERQE